MNWNRSLLPIIGMMGLGCPITATGSHLLGVATLQEIQSQDAPQQHEENELFIETDSPLPDTYPGGTYEVHLAVRGGVPPLRWHLEKGALPVGIKLEESGLIHGTVERQGEFQFTAAVTDSGKPQQAFEKTFIIHVRSAMTVAWKTPAHVSGNRIEGSVEVSNTTPNNMDLTFIVLAVAGDGRATAIGYQHFELLKGTLAKEVPFGETLPHGGYVVHVDVVGEVPPKDRIYRERLQTPGPLQVNVGP